MPSFSSSAIIAATRPFVLLECFAHYYNMTEAPRRHQGRLQVEDTYQRKRQEPPIVQAKRRRCKHPIRYGEVEDIQTIHYQISFSGSRLSLKCSLLFGVKARFHMARCYVWTTCWQLATDGRDGKAHGPRTQRP